MSWQFSRLIVAGTFAAFFWAPPAVHAAQGPDHDQHRPDVSAATQGHKGEHHGAPMTTRDAKGMMMTPDAKVDALVKKMNEATGQAKVDAMAELLTALVQDRRTMHTHMMASMQGMMKEMCHGEAQAVESKK